MRGAFRKRQPVSPTALSVPDLAMPPSPTCGAGHRLRGRKDDSSIMACDRILRCACALGLCVLGCAREPGVGVTPPIGDTAAPHLYWTQPAAESVGQLAGDSTRVFALGSTHNVTALNKADGKILWRVTLPLTVTGTYGRSVLYAGQAVIVGDEDVFGLEPTTGAVRWHFAPAVGSGPGRWLMATRGDTVITGSSSGDVFALNAGDGSLIWRARLPDSLMSVSFVNVENPILDGDMVLVRYTQHLPAFPFFLGGAAAFRMASGAFVWAQGLPQPFSSKTVQVGAESAALTNGVFAVSSYAGFVYAFDRGSGQLLWTAPPDPSAPQFEGAPGPDMREMAGDAGRFFVGSGLGWVTAFDAPTGRQLWRVNGGMGGTTPGIWTFDGNVYSTHLGGQVVSYEGSSGHVRWILNDSRAAVTYGLLFDGGRIYAGDVSGPVFAVAQ